jgi:peptidoglycan lytic transglycosylase
VRQRLGQALLIATVLGVGACSQSPTRTDTAVGGESTPGGPYTQAHDAAPVRTIAAEDVADAPLRPDPILSAGNKTPYTVNGVSYQIMDDASGYRVKGIASWYGTKFHGHKTSNGEIYDLYAATAAHKTLPIPSYARVTNLDNGHSVVVRVNDRGPFHADRVIDLSYAAAIKLGYMEHGTARVEVEAIEVTGVDDRRGTVSGDYRYLQMGAFGAEASAVRMRDELAVALSAPVSVSEVRSGEKMLYRVRIGPMTASGELANTQRQLQELGYNPGQPLP